MGPYQASVITYSSDAGGQRPTWENLTLPFCIIPYFHCPNTDLEDYEQNTSADVVQISIFEWLYYYRIHLPKIQKERWLCPTSRTSSKIHHLRNLFRNPAMSGPFNVSAISGTETSWEWLSVYELIPRPCPSFSTWSLMMLVLPSSGVPPVGSMTLPCPTRSRPILAVLVRHLAINSKRS